MLLNSEFEACISDFGTARFLKPESSNWTAMAGTYGYVAPGKPALQFCFYFTILFEKWLFPQFQFRVKL